LIPWPWTLPPPADSWFEIHFHDINIPEDYYRQRRMDRNTFQALLGILGPWKTRHNTRFREPEKVLALGIYWEAHGNSYLSI